MLSDEQSDEGVVFPSEEEVMNILKGNLSLPVTKPEVNDAVCLLPNQSAVVFGILNTRINGASVSSWI